MQRIIEVDIVGHIGEMQQERTGGFFLDIGLLDGRIMRIMDRVEGIPYVQVCILDRHQIGTQFAQQLIAVRNLGSQIRARLQREIDTYVLTAEGQTEPLRIGMQHIP